MLGATQSIAAAMKVPRTGIIECLQKQLRTRNVPNVLQKLTSFADDEPHRCRGNQDDQGLLNRLTRKHDAFLCCDASKRRCPELSRGFLK